MEPIRIRMSTIDDVKHFVTQANAQVSDIDVVSGRYLVDAKSLLGLFSLDENGLAASGLERVDVVVHGTPGDREKFAEAISRLIVKD